MSVPTEPTLTAPAPAIERLVERWARKYGERITGYFRRPAQPARLTDFPPELSPELREALERRGIGRLYSHQREAWDHVQAGEHVVVVTPTASGKTLCYNLPVLEAVRAAKAKALYLFPTKALAQDQVAELLELNAAGALGVTLRRVSIRDQSSRWGSCSTTGVLSYSWRLILTPPFVLDYLAAHEAAHLVEMNHSRAFWRQVERICPDFRRAKSWLDANGADLHRYGNGG